jgi:hypothetical protein
MLNIEIRTYTLQYLVANNGFKYCLHTRPTQKFSSINSSVSIICANKLSFFVFGKPGPIFVNNNFKLQY